MAEREANKPNDPQKQRFLSNLTSVAMFAGLATAYGTLAAIMARFLYPARPSPKGWMFVGTVAQFDTGASRVFRTPSGESVNITRRGSGGAASDFVALSSVCPHLGCQVHWEPQNDRYFCPCHNGVFSPDGVATSGPPADAGQSLLEYPLNVERNLLFIEVAQSVLAMGPGRLVEPSGPPGPGHDPCLYAAKNV
jgi:nitrite reductase/ring-hydroxylating ferredoxin subunit